MGKNIKKSIKKSIKKVSKKPLSLREQKTSVSVLKITRKKLFVQKNLKGLKSIDAVIDALILNQKKR